MTVHIVTDSTCDLPERYINEYGISVIPLNVHFGEDIYKDGVDLNTDDFYWLLVTSNHHPTTSQPSPGDFMNVYKDIAYPGDHIISIHISSELSGTYQSAVMARDMLSESNEHNIDIHIVDSRITSTSLGMMVIEASKMAVNGEGLNDILSKLDQLKNKIETYFMVDTLEYLEKGGRIGKAQAFLGSLLSVKPILALEEGIVVPLKKIRGRKKGLDYIISTIEKKYKDSKVNVAVMHANVPGEAEKLVESVKEKLYYNKIITSELGPIVGTHAGSGTLGIGIYKT